MSGIISWATGHFLTYFQFPVYLVRGSRSFPVQLNINCLPRCTPCILWVQQRKYNTHELQNAGFWNTAVGR